MTAANSVFMKILYGDGARTVFGLAAVAAVFVAFFAGEVAIGISHLYIL